MIPAPTVRRVSTSTREPRGVPGLRRAALAIGLVGALALAGCAPAGGDAGPGQGGGQSAGEPTTGSLGVSVLGEPWTAPTVTMGAVADPGDRVQREIIAGGGGPAIDDRSLVVANAGLYDTSNGAVSSPYGPIGSVIDMADPSLDPVLREVILGAPAGSRVAALVPPAAFRQGGVPSGPPQLIVIDLATIEHTSAWGAPQEPTQTLVTLGPDGPDGALGDVTIDASQPAPDHLVLDLAKLGDGPAVNEGQSVTVQYRGLLFPSGTEFDSSWSRAVPARFATDKVVPGFSRALVGRSVGSRVIAVIPPELGYGDEGAGADIPPDSTLVFVIDILDAH